MTEANALPHAGDRPFTAGPGQELPALLSRLAALQGQAVPAYRFASTVTAEGTGDMAGIEPASLVRELWQTHFPLAEAATLAPQDAQAGRFPLFWVSDTGDRCRILLVRLSQGDFVAEEASGRKETLSQADARRGRLLELKPGQQAADFDGRLPRTAGEWFVATIKRYRTVFAEAVLASFLISIIGLLAALYSMQVYDRVVPSKGYSTLLVLTLGVGIAILLELLLKQVRAHLVDRACKAIDQELSAIFFAKALAIRMDARPRTVGSFASQIRHFESVRGFMTSSTLFILADTPFALVFVGVIALISPPVALVPLVMVPLSLLLGWAFRGPIERSAALHMTESNRKNGLLIEAIDGIESIKSVGAEWKLLDQWNRLTSLLGGNELRMKALSTLSSNLTQTLQQFTYVGMVCLGAYLITLGELTMGGLIACTIISGRALAPLTQFPGLIVQWKHAQIALKGLDGIMAMPSDREAGARLIVPEACQGRLRLDQAVFAYHEARAALDVPALRIEPGERVAVLGAVGSGKTTLLKLLSGLYRPKNGRCYLDDLDIAQVAPEFVREQIGYLPQDVRLFQGTLRDNLTLGLPTPGDSQLLRAATLTGLIHAIQAHPKGLDLEISEGGKGLSGGQRQLVGLTRMLLLRPRILLLDEPTASMDAQLEESVMRHLFQEIAPDSTLVVVTHKTSLLAHVNRIIVIDQGRIVLDGPRDQVLARLRQPAAPATPVAVAPARSLSATEVKS